MDRRRLVELLVDVEQPRIALLWPAHRGDAIGADLREPLRLDRQADDLDRVDLEQRLGGSMPFTIGTFAALWPR